MLSIQNNMASMNDEALEIIWREGGRASVYKVAGEMKISTDYARTILYDLGVHDYLDVDARDTATLTRKGRERLERRGILRKLEGERKKARNSFFRNLLITLGIL